MTQILLTQNLQTVNELEHLYDRDFNLCIDTLDQDFLP
jgi:hypothetical protein